MCDLDTLNLLYFAFSIESKSVLTLNHPVRGNCADGNGSCKSLEKQINKPDNNFNIKKTECLDREQGRLWETSKE